MKLFFKQQAKVVGSGFVLALAFFIQASTLSGAEWRRYFLTPEAVDVVALLPAPPLPASPEDLADMATVVNARNQCSSNELAAALVHDRSLTAFNMAPFIGDFFTASRLPKTAALLRHAQSDTSCFVAAAKANWKRLRPSVVDTNLLVTTPDLDFSYPSGHSAGATMVALILMDLDPEHAGQILAASRAAGWQRVQLARHYPSDIQAGRVLAQAVFHAMKANLRYQQEFAEAQAEMAAAKAATASPPPAAPAAKATEAVAH